MKETVLITGAGPNGVTGRLLKEWFEARYDVLVPNSRQLDLTNDKFVCKYFDACKIDYVIHCATFRPHCVSSSHFVDDELESNLRMFFTLASQSSKYKKMVYLGSGAEFDKSKPIILASEKDFGRSIPKTKYGLGKYIMNTYTRQSENIYNLRLFGTLSKYEKPEKNVVSNLCVKAINNIPLSLKQDCLYSFMDLEKLPSIIDYLFHSDIPLHDINIAIDEPVLLSDIAKMIISYQQSGSLRIEKEGLNMEYTADTTRMRMSIPPPFWEGCIESAVRRVYDYYCENNTEIDINSIDNRWK